MSIQKEAMKWVIGNRGLKVHDFNYKSPRISSEYIDCSMPMTFDSMNYCGMGCTYCIEGKTPVYGKNLPRGKQQIAKLQVGDGVWSFNETTQQAEEDVVTSIMARTTNEYYEIDTEDGHTIKITGEHPILVVGKGWVEVQHLVVGDEVMRIHPYISPGAKNLTAYNTSDAGRNKVVENGNSSQGETLLASILDEYNVDYVSQFVYDDTRRARGHYVVDFLLPSWGIALEYDEHTRHFTPEGIQFDTDRDAYLLSEYSVTVHRFRNRGCALSKPRMVKFLQQIGVVK